MGFIMCSTLAVFSGLFSASRVGIVQATVGRDIVLCGVGAAVVGGVSLFGGRGRLLHAAVGALVISIITNGLGLLGLPGGHQLARHRRRADPGGDDRRSVAPASGSVVARSLDR